MTLEALAHVMGPTDGEVAELGIIRMRFVAAGDATGGAFTLADVTGGEGAWTIPHIHREMEESFFVLEGRFTFTVGDHSVSAGPGSYVLVPRGTPHTLGSGPEGGRCLVLMVPGGLERMFLELARLPGDSLRDPKIRAAVAAKHDSVPV